MRELLVEQHAGLVRRFQLRLGVAGCYLSKLRQATCPSDHPATAAATRANRAALIDCLLVIRDAKFEVHGTSIH